MSVLSLLQEAKYCIAPKLLARGESEAIHSGVFPVYYGDGITPTDLVLENMEYPYGYVPDIEAIRFEGRASGSSAMRMRNMQIKPPGGTLGESAVTIFADARVSTPLATDNPDCIFHFKADVTERAEVNFIQYVEGQYSQGSSRTQVFCPERGDTPYNLFEEHSYPTNIRKSIVLQSDGNLTHKWGSDSHVWRSISEPKILYDNIDYFSYLDLGVRENWAYFKGRIYLFAIWNRALTTEELNDLHEASLNSYPYIKANDLGSGQAEIVEGPAPVVVTTTAFPPAPSYDVNLLNECVYGIVPELLAKGNKNSDQSEGMFPVYYGSVNGEDIPITPFELRGFTDEGGYKADSGAIVFDASGRLINWDAYVPANYHTIWMDIEGEVDEEPYSGSGPWGVVYRLGEEGAEVVSSPETDYALAHKGDEIEHSFYSQNVSSPYAVSFPTRYRLAISFEKSYEGGAGRVFRSINNGPAHSIRQGDWQDTSDPTMRLHNPFGLYRVFDLGARRTWAPLKGKLKSFFVFSRLLHEEELTYLYEQSLDGWPELKANELSDKTVEFALADPPTTTTSTSTTPPPPKTARELLEEASYGIFPELLGKNSAESSKDSGYFPTYYGGATPTGQEFSFQNTSLPDSGFDASDKSLIFDRSQNTRLLGENLDIDKDEMTIFVDIEGEQPASETKETIFRIGNHNYPNGAEILSQHGYEDKLINSYTKLVPTWTGGEGYEWDGGEVTIYSAGDLQGAVNQVQGTGSGGGIVNLGWDGTQNSGSRVRITGNVLIRGTGNNTGLRNGSATWLDFGGIGENLFVGVSDIDFYSNGGGVLLNGNSGTLIIGDCTFQGFNSRGRLLTSTHGVGTGRIRGVFFNCNFVNNDTMYGFLYFRGDGGASWQRPLFGANWIRDDCLTFEDCYFSNSYPYWTLVNNGTKYMLRRCTLNMPYTQQGHVQLLDCHGQQYEVGTRPSEDGQDYGTRLLVVSECEWEIDSGTHYRGSLCRGGRIIFANNNVTGDLRHLVTTTYPELFTGSVFDTNQFPHFWMYGNTKSGSSFNTVSEGAIANIANWGSDRFHYTTHPDNPDFSGEHPYRSETVAGDPEPDTTERSHTLSDSLPARYKRVTFVKNGEISTSWFGTSLEVEHLDFDNQYINRYDNLCLGARLNSAFLNGKLKTFLIIPRRISDSEALTLASASNQGWSGIMAESYGTDEKYCRIIEATGTTTTTSTSTTPEPTTTTLEPTTTTTPEPTTTTPEPTTTTSSEPTTTTTVTTTEHPTTTSTTTLPPEIYGRIEMGIRTVNRPFTVQTVNHIVVTEREWGIQEIGPNKYFDKENLQNPEEVITAMEISTMPLSEPHTVYTVKQGDTLSGIAEDIYGDMHQWREIQEANPSIIDPNTLRPGQRLEIPSLPEEIYRTEEGRAIRIPEGYTKDNPYLFEVKYEEHPAIEVKVFGYIAIQGGIETDEDGQILNRVLPDGIITKEELYASGARLYLKSYDHDIVFIIKGKLLEVRGQRKLYIESLEDYSFLGQKEYVFPENPLIQTTEQAERLANKALKTYKLRKGVSIDWRGNPALELGDGVKVPDYYRPNKIMTPVYTNYYIMKQNQAFDGGFKTVTEGREIPREEN